MKVTALIPDDLIQDVRDLAPGRTLTDSLIIALKEWKSSQTLKILKERVRKAPFAFSKNFSALKSRELNRNQ